MGKARPAYTLFEMLVVVAIIVVLAALAIPSMDAFFSEYRLNAGTDAVRANWELARTHSMNEGRAYRFAVVHDKGNFRIAPDTSQFWGDGGSMADQGENGGTAFERIEAGGKNRRDMRAPALEQSAYVAHRALRDLFTELDT